jgi:hypothetical protein
MRMLGIALVALALVATPALAAVADLPDAALKAVPDDFVDCSLYHVGLFLETGNPVHLTHPVTICAV